MNTTTYNSESFAIKAWVEKRVIYIELTDGRIFGFPDDRFLILSKASDEQFKDVKNRSRRLCSNMGRIR